MKTVAEILKEKGDQAVYSIGPDGLTNASLTHANSRDDVVRARDGGFIGTAEEFDP